MATIRSSDTTILAAGIFGQTLNAINSISQTAAEAYGIAADISSGSADINTQGTQASTSASDATSEYYHQLKGLNLGNEELASASSLRLYHEQERDRTYSSGLYSEGTEHEVIKETGDARLLFNPYTAASAMSIYSGKLYSDTQGVRNDGYYDYFYRMTSSTQFNADARYTQVYDALQDRWQSIPQDGSKIFSVQNTETESWKGFGTIRNTTTFSLSSKDGLGYDQEGVSGRIDKLSFSRKTQEASPDGGWSTDDTYQTTSSINGLDGALNIAYQSYLTLLAETPDFVLDAADPYDILATLRQALDDLHASLLSGNDKLTASGLGGSYLDAGAGNDMLTGNGAWDTLLGGTGNDTIKAAAGYDELYGDAGNDQLDGAAGDDLLEGGLGSDLLKGGSGEDTFFFSAGDSPLQGGDSILDFSWEDTIKLDFRATFRDVVVLQEQQASLDSLLAAATTAFAAGDRVLAGYTSKSGFVVVDMDGDAQADTLITLTGIKSAGKISIGDFSFS